MKSKRLSDVFACLMAVLSESVPIALQTSGIEILGSSRWHGSSHSLCFLEFNGLANEFAGYPMCSGKDFAHLLGRPSLFCVSAREARCKYEG